MAENASPYAAWEIRRAEARSLFEQYEGMKARFDSYAPGTVEGQVRAIWDLASHHGQPEFSSEPAAYYLEKFIAGLLEQLEAPCRCDRCRDCVAADGYERLREQLEAFRQAVLEDEAEGTFPHHCSQVLNPATSPSYDDLVQAPGADAHVCHNDASSPASRPRLVQCLYCNKTHAVVDGDTPCGGLDSNWIDASVPASRSDVSEPDTETATESVNSRVASGDAGSFSGSETFDPASTPEERFADADLEFNRANEWTPDPASKPKEG